MADKKSDTTVDNLINLIESSVKAVGDGNREPFNNLIKSIEKTIPVKGKKRMPKTDPNLNKKFKIKRIGYSVIAEIGPDADGLYRATILSVTEGESPFDVGESLPISKRELELSGTKVLDI